MDFNLFNLYLRISKAFSVFFYGLISNATTPVRMLSDVSVAVTISPEINRVTLITLGTYDPNTLATYDATTLQVMDYTVLA